MLSPLAHPDGRHPIPNEPDDGPVGPPPPVDPLILEMVRSQTGMEGPAAISFAAGVAVKVRQREEGRLAELIVTARTAAYDQRLDLVQAVRGDAFLQETEIPATALLGEVAAEGHNITVTAMYKSGKTTLAGNAAAALTAGGNFLGRFPTLHPRRVAWLNYELTADDQRSLVRALNLPADALERLLVVNLRGSRLSLSTPTGRDWLIARLIEHEAEVLIGDTYGAAVAPSIESENDNAGARRFLTTVDEIKALAGCTSSIWTCHTGRKTHEEGAEHARGATVLDDWADVRLVLTKDTKTGARFLSSDGRSAYNLPESALHYDPHTRGLWLLESAIGANRQMQRAETGSETVATIVTDAPGISTSDLRDALAEEGITSNTDKSAAMTKAKTRGLIHTHKVGKTVEHHSGQIHPEGTPCNP